MTRVGVGNLCAECRMIRSSLLALSFVAALVCAADDPPIETDGPARITFRRDDSGKVVAVKITPVSSCGPSCKCGAAASELAASPLAQAVQKAARVEVGDSPALTGKAAVIYQGLAARAQVAPVVTWARFHDDAFAEAEATTLLKGARMEVLKIVQSLPTTDRAKASAAFKTAGRALSAVSGGSTPSGGDPSTGHGSH